MKRHSFQADFYTFYHFLCLKGILCGEFLFCYNKID